MFTNARINHSFNTKQCARENSTSPYTCFYCHELIFDNNRTVEHLLPRGAYYRNKFVVLAHKECNDSRGSIEGIYNDFLTKTLFGKIQDKHIQRIKIELEKLKRIYVDLEYRMIHILFTDLLELMMENYAKHSSNMYSTVKDCV